VPVEGLHTETGPGVFEAAILYTSGIDAGDRGILFKQAAKEIGQRFGIMPSFMAKWSTQYPGLQRPHPPEPLRRQEESVLRRAPPAPDVEALRELPRGQLALLEDLQAMYAPTVNSYKRLVDGMWAPVKRTWGVDNRTSTLRVIPGSAKSTRLESRCPGADVNRTSRSLQSSARGCGESRRSSSSRTHRSPAMPPRPRRFRACRAT
jgi:glutamine synthetase